MQLLKGQAMSTEDCPTKREDANTKGHSTMKDRDFRAKDSIYPIVDYSEYPVTGVPNNWGAVPAATPLMKAKVIADYIVGALGSSTTGYLKGELPESIKKSTSFAEANWVTTEDARNIVSDAIAHSGIEAAPFEFKQFTVKSSVNFTPDKAVYHSANQISQAATLHMKIEEKKPKLSLSDSYQSLIEERVIEEDDLPFVLRYLTLARHNSGQPFFEKEALEKFAQVGYWAFSISGKIKDWPMLTEEDRRVKHLIVHTERIPKDIRTEILASPARQSAYWRSNSNAQLRESFAKAVKISTHISDEKMRLATDYVISTDEPTLPILLPIQLMANAVSGLLRAVRDSIDWSFNLTLSDVARKYDPTAEDENNLEKLVLLAYEYRPSSGSVPDRPTLQRPAGIDNSGCWLDERMQLSGINSFSGKVKFKDADEPDSYVIASHRGIDNPSLFEPICLLRRNVAGGYYEISYQDRSKTSRVEILSGSKLVTLDPYDSTTSPGAINWNEFRADGDASIQVLEADAPVTRKGGRINFTNRLGVNISDVTVRYRASDSDSKEGETTCFWKTLRVGEEAEWQDFWHPIEEPDFWWVSFITDGIQYVCSNVFNCNIPGKLEGSTEVKVELLHDRNVRINFSPGDGCTTPMHRQ
ncbi:hypothetical protein [Streptomyces sp. NPDC051577]|uniref:hypothetical protein n=1 Tax=Streptomyces sp. NPDC051577 TaxID=3155166 RepID=UPI00341E94AD